jgi:hypothetical protein
MKRLSITFGFLFLVNTSVWASDTRYWQVVLSYTEDTIRIIEATPISSMSKTPVTPGLAGTPVKVEYAVDWLNGAGTLLTSSTEQLPLGYRTAPQDSAPCQIIIPESDLVILRIHGPEPTSAPASLRLSQLRLSRATGAPTVIPSVFQRNILNLPIENFTPAAPRPMAGPVGSAKIRDTGPDGNRMVIVVMGDGYTAADLATGAFTTAANSLVTAFLGKSPWDEAFSVANVYRIDVESNQSGADQDPQGTFKDTYFNSSFWVAGIERLLAIDGTGQSRAIAAANSYVGAGMWDAIFILVNSTKYGGSGGFIAVSSVHPAASEVILHECGHTFAGLADEYTSPYPGYPPGDSEPNVDFDFSGPGLKWNIWVEPGTPLPTPQTSTYANKVGTFEGARYLTSGIYRPYLNCLMQQLNVPFCPICKEANLLTLLTETILLADTAIPWPSNQTFLLGSSPTAFSAIPLPMSSITSEWTINNQPLADTAGFSASATAGDLLATGMAIGSVQLRLRYVSPMIRKQEVSLAYSWVVKSDCNDNGQDDLTDIQLGILADANHDLLPDNCVPNLCCTGLTGNVDCSPGDGVDISDLSSLIDFLYITFTDPCCPDEANTDGQPGIDISDLAALIDYLYISFTPPAACQ